MTDEEVLELGKKRAAELGLDRMDVHDQQRFGAADIYRLLGEAEIYLAGNGEYRLSLEVPRLKESPERQLLRECQAYIFAVSENSGMLSKIDQLLKSEPSARSAGNRGSK